MKEEIEWIPVTKRLPDTRNGFSDYVLAYSPVPMFPTRMTAYRVTMKRVVAYSETVSRWETPDGEIDDVTHWAEIPRGPKA